MVAFGGELPMFRVWGDLAGTDRVIIVQACVGAWGNLWFEGG